MPHDPRAKRLPVAESVSLHSLVWADGDDAVPFLLVHGLSSNARTWEAVGSILHAEGHAVAALDLRGHGRSDKPDGGYDFATLTADLLAAIDVLGFDRPVVAGQSTGGNLAVELAHRAPDRVRAAVGVDGGVLELQRRWPSWEDCERKLAPPRFERTLVDEFAELLRRQHPDWDDRAVAATMGNVEVLEDGTIRPRLSRERHLRLLRSLWEHRPSRLLPALEVPLLLVPAENDDDWAETRKQEAAEAEAAGPHVVVEWLAGDHDLHVQHPEPLARLLLNAAKQSTGGS